MDYLNAQSNKLQREDNSPLNRYVLPSAEVGAGVVGIGISASGGAASCATTFGFGCIAATVGVYTSSDHMITGLNNFGKKASEQNPTITVQSLKQLGLSEPAANYIQFALDTFTVGKAGMSVPVKSAKPGYVANAGNSATVITPEVETKILFGQRVTNSSGAPTNRLIGAHGGEISNTNLNYAVEVLSVNADGTRNAKLVTQFSDGNLSKIKSSTLFPENWTSSQTIGAVKQVGNMSPVATRADGATLYQATVNGVKIEVIKVGNNVTAAYPCGRSCTSPATFTGK